MIGFYIDNNNYRPSTRIRYLNTIKFLQKGYIELYNESNYKNYNAILFGKKFSIKDVEFAKKIKQDGKKLLFDLCDNYLHNPKNLNEYEKHRKNLEFILKASDKIILSTQQLKIEIVKHFHELNEKIDIIGDPYEINMPKGSISNRLEAFNIFCKYKILNFKKNELNLIWYGTANVVNAECGMLDLFLIKNILYTINDINKIHLTIISNNKNLYNKISPWKIKTSYIEWNDNNVLQILKLQDAAVIPINLNDWTVCKTDNRVITPIMNNVDVIATEIPSYSIHDKYSFLNKWDHGLREVLYCKNNISKKNNRIKLGQYNINKYCHISCIAKKWDSIFSDLI